MTMAVINTIAIVLTRLLVFSCLTEAQPTELTVDITERDSPQAITRIEIDDVPRDIDLVFGKTYNLTCISNTGFDDDAWYKLDSENIMQAVTTTIPTNSSMTSTYVYVQENNNDKKILTLQNYALSEMGTYVCFKNSDCNKSVTLGEANPSIFTSKQELSLQKGTSPDDPHQEVFITGDPRPDGNSVQWYKDSVLLTAGLKAELQIDILPTGALFFNGFTEMKHGGNYTALVNNSAGVSTASILVTVLIKPKLKLTVSSSTPILGNEFQIQCRDSEGDPLPQFSWFYNGDEIISGENGYMIYNQSEDVSVLSISQILFSHTGSYKCEAINTAGITTKTTSVEVLLPSPSTPMINVISSNGSNYAGSVVTMQCVSTVQSSDLFNGELTAEFTWKKNGEDVNDAADSRVTISPLPKNGLTFSTQLRLSPASSVVDSGSYTCEVKATSNQSSSEVIESDTAELVVEVPPVNVELTPTSVDIPNTMPYNSLNFTCTASVPDQITSPTVFSWLMNGDEPLEHGNGDVIIINDNMTSTLSLSPSNPGTVQVTCKFDVHLPSEDPMLTLLHNATVIVRGPIPPVLPINIEAVHIEYNSTIIQWTTTEITYTPESYYIKYGTSSNNLLLQSATLKGSDNLSTTDQEFEIKLTSLDHNTVYYYSVVSENQHETVESEIMSFQTPKLALLQIKGGPFRGCIDGRVLDKPSVKNFLKEKVSETIREKCDCSFPKENLINATVLCTETNSNTLIYRSYAIPTNELTSSEIIAILEAWINSEPVVVDVVAEISFDGTCNVSLSSLEDPVCTTPEEPTVGRVDESNNNTFGSNTLILISVILGGIIFVLIVVIIIVGIHSYTQYRRLRKMHNRRVSNNYLTVKRESSFVEPPPPRRTSNRQQWEGDVSISDCPAYLYSYKPKTEEPPPIIERVPTPGIYDSIDNLSGGRLNPRGIPNPIITQLENENSNETNDDSTGSSVMS